MKAHSVVASSLLFFVATLFLTLGVGNPQSVLKVRYVLALVIVVAGLILLFKELHFRFENSKNVNFVFLLLFLLIILRGVLGAGLSVLGPGGGDSLVPHHYYLEATFSWFLVVGLFFLSQAVFYDRRHIQNLSWTLLFSSFFIALILILNVFTHGELDYTGQLGGKKTLLFFPLLLHDIPLFDMYVLGKYYFVNNFGDLMILGVFPSVGMVFYLLSNDRKRGGGPAKSLKLFSVGLSLFMAGFVFAAAAMVESRGTIVAVSAAIILFFVMILIKYPLKKIVLASLLCLSILAVIWNYLGDIGAVWHEAQSLIAEFSHKRSLSSNLEGAKRAWQMFLDNPFLGVGTGKYHLFSSLYGQDVGRFSVTSMCYYLTLLAEEGAIGVVYILFLVFYFITIMKRVLTTESRFNFFLTLGLASSVFLVFLHAFITNLMELFPFQSLIYILMGASLGISSKAAKLDYNE